MIFNRDQGVVKDSLNWIMKEDEGGQLGSESSQGFSKPDIERKHENE